MKGLLIKDFYMFSKYCRAFLLIAVIFIAVSFYSENNVFLYIYPVMIAGIIPMTLISYDERSNWNLYSGTLPYSKTQLVSAKYLIGLIFSGCIYIFTMFAFMLKLFIKNSFSLNALLFLGTFLLVISVTGPTFLLPFVFKYGAEKGRIVYYVIIGLFCVLTAFLVTGDLQTVLQLNQKWILGISVISAFLLYALSWVLSIIFYKNREL